MTYVPHYRLTMAGELPAGEAFSCNLALTSNDAPLIELLDFFTNDIPGALWDDIVADCSAFWARPASGINLSAVLKRIKLAAIDENGHYAGAAREAAVNVGGGDNNVRHPLQMSRKITFEADEDLGRVKGGFYLPAPTTNSWDAATNLTSVAYTESVRDSVQTFLNDLNNAPGFDANSLRVVIASQGRRSRTGAVTMPPKNCYVKRVNVGRRLDVQRRRANKISEARIADVAVG